MKNKKLMFVTRTAIFIALLVVVQYVTSTMGQLVTGSAVNFVLIAACLLVDWKSALIIAVLSPFAAKMSGIGPALLPVVPVVAVGNAVLVFAYAFLMSEKVKLPQYGKWSLAVVSAALLKYAVLTLGVLKVVVPLAGVPAPMADKLSVMFGVTQFFTALIGGALATLIVPPLKKALARK